MKVHQRITIIVITLCVILLSLQTTIAAETPVLNYYYSTSCGSCKQYTEIIEEIEQNYTGEIIVIKKDVSDQENHDEWKGYGFKSYPSAVIDDEIIIPKENITREKLESIIESHLSELEKQEAAIPLLERLLPAILATAIILILAAIGIIVWKKERKSE